MENFEELLDDAALVLIQKLRAMKQNTVNLKQFQLLTKRQQLRASSKANSVAATSSRHLGTKSINISNALLEKSTMMSSIRRDNFFDD